MESLKADYERRKEKIKRRLLNFRKVWEKNEEFIFKELCFCLCTPQTKARTCDVFIEKIFSNGILLSGSREEIRKHMKGVRFCENKSQRIVEAREFFTRSGNIEIKKYINRNRPMKTREWLIKNIKGLGLKESSHFMRNIGLGQEVAILDRHILRNLKKYGVIEDMPKCLTRKRYLNIERKMKQFSKKTEIPLDELDLLFWSRETGEIFK